MDLKRWRVTPSAITRPVLPSPSCGGAPGWGALIGTNGAARRTDYGEASSAVRRDGGLRRSLSSLRERYRARRGPRLARTRWAPTCTTNLNPGFALICLGGLTTFSHTVEKSTVFARRVTLRSSQIRLIVVIVRCRPVVDRRWCVGKTRSGVCGDHALIWTNNSVPVCVTHRGRVRGATQGDQKAQGQDRTHRFSPIHLSGPVT